MRVLRPALLALALQGCAFDDGFVPYWEDLPDPVQAADCVFTTIAASWQRGTCSPVFVGVSDWEEGGIGGYDVEALDVMGGTGYLMLYTGLSASNAGTIGAAASLDAKNWSRAAAGAVIAAAGEGGSVEVLCTALREADATLHLWYAEDSGPGGDPEVFHAVSSDGTGWVTDPGPVPGLVGTEGEAFRQIEGCSARWNVQRGDFEAWWGGIIQSGEPGSFTYRAAIDHASSLDGSSFAFDGTPFEPAGEGTGAFDAAGVVQPSVVCEDGFCSLLYVGWDTLTQAGGTGGNFIPGERRLALASSPDGGLTWERDAGDLSLLTTSDDAEHIDRPRGVFANGWMMLFLQDNVGTEQDPTAGITLFATAFPPAGLSSGSP